MSIRIEGDFDFQYWYYENYGIISPIVPFEIYREYLDYKKECREKNKCQLIIILGAILVIISWILIWRLLCLTGFII